MPSSRATSLPWPGKPKRACSLWGLCSPGSPKHPHLVHHHSLVSSSLYRWSAQVMRSQAITWQHFRNSKSWEPHKITWNRAIHEGYLLYLIYAYILFASFSGFCCFHCIIISSCFVICTIVVVLYCADKKCKSSAQIHEQIGAKWVKYCKWRSTVAKICILFIIQNVEHCYQKHLGGNKQNAK